MPRMLSAVLVLLLVSLFSLPAAAGSGLFRLKDSARFVPGEVGSPFSIDIGSLVLEGRISEVSQTPRGRVGFGTLSTPDGTMEFSVRGGRVAATFRIGEWIYELRTEEDGSQVVREISARSFAPEYQDTIVPEETGLRERGTSMDPVPAVAGDPDTGNEVDVMVLFTTKARTERTDILNDIELMVSGSNAAFSTSGADVRIRLKGPFEVAYTSSGNLDTDLGRLRGKGDGFMDGIHLLRDQFAADCVVLLVGSGSGACGLAYMMEAITPSFEDDAFSVVDVHCGSTNLTFPHELGHNMGLRHDCATDNRLTPRSEAHGYVNIAARFRTIMALNDSCRDCNRVSRFSNPDRTYTTSFGTGTTGSTSGSCQADNVATLEDSDGTVSNFRLRSSLDGSADSDGDGLPDSVDTASSNSVATPASTTGRGRVTLTIADSLALRNVVSLSPHDVRFGSTGRPTEGSFAYGMFGFTIIGLSNGAGPSVTLQFPMAIPSDARFYVATGAGFSRVEGVNASGRLASFQLDNSANAASLDAGIGLWTMETLGDVGQVPGTEEGGCFLRKRP